MFGISVPPFKWKGYDDRIMIDDGPYLNRRNLLDNQEILPTKDQGGPPPFNPFPEPDDGMIVNPRAPFEKLVGKDNLRSISFLEMGLLRSRSVCHITIPGISVATGFLIDVDILLTNHHVFPSAADAKDAVCKFNYQVDLHGNLQPTTEFVCDPDDFFYTNEELDYSIVRVKGMPGLTWGTIQVPGETLAEVGDDVIIIQHPNGLPKMISITNNNVTYVDDKLVQYVTDTLPGSSGSPVFNDRWELVALHHSGGTLVEPRTGKSVFGNEGISISAIKKTLPQWNVSRR